MQGRATAGALLERARELDTLDALIAGLGEGGGCVVAIEARAGLGKTRLLHAARAAAADAGVLVLAARATELERDFPFALVRQLLEPALETLPAADRDTLLSGAARGALGLGGDGVHDAFTVLHALYRLTAALAERRPLLLAVDDVHWADAASLDFLWFLLPRLDDLAALVVLTARPDEPGASPAVARIATDASVRRLEPRALTPDATAALLAGELGVAPAPAFAATCHELSGGNPFLLCELVRTLAQKSIAPAAEQADLLRELTPGRVAQTVGLRLARLSPDARAFARGLVVLGDDSELAMVAALARLDGDAARHGADELRRAAILDPGEQLRFVHPLVRNAVRSELGVSQRAAEHARAAHLLREHGADAERVALHLLASDPRGDAATVQTLLEAAMRALASGAPRAVAAYLTRALREPPAPELRPVVLGPLLLASLALADHTVYDAIEGEVFGELERSPELRGQWAPLLTTWLAANGRFEQAIDFVREAAAEAARAGEAEAAFRLESLLSLLTQEPVAAARARLEPWFGRFEPGSNGGRLAAGLRAQWSMFDGSAADAVALARRALDDPQIFVKLPELLIPAWPVLALITADELDEARRVVGPAAEIARERGSGTQLGAMSMLEGRLALQLGELTVAEAAIRQTLDATRLGGIAALVPVARTLLVDVLIARGDLAQAERVLDEPDIGPAMQEYAFWFSVSRLLRGRVRLAQGRPREAAEDFLELRERSRRWQVDGNPGTPVAGWAARALATTGERERARALADEELVHARRWGAPSVVSFALRAKAMAVGGDEGVELLREAVAGLDGSPARLERARALDELGTALRRARRRVEARQPLREALALARRCGAVALARHAAAELEASGERRRQRHGALGVDALTPSERRVADLAASGMTNRQIANTLYLTIKTVETHLSAAYDKLSIRSREQLPDALGGVD